MRCPVGPFPLAVVLGRAPSCMAELLLLLPLLSAGESDQGSQLSLPAPGWALSGSAAGAGKVSCL